MVVVGIPYSINGPKYCMVLKLIAIVSAWSLDKHNYPCFGFWSSSMNGKPEHNI